MHIFSISYIHIMEQISYRKRTLRKIMEKRAGSFLMRGTRSKNSGSSSTMNDEPNERSCR